MADFHTGAAWGRTSPSWLDAVAVLIEVLERGGLSGVALTRGAPMGDRDHDGAGDAEASLALPEQIAGARASPEAMSDAGRARLAPLIPHLTRLTADDFFAYAADRTISALVEVTNRRKRFKREACR